MKFCPKCGKRLRLLTGKFRGQAFCPECGTRVSEAEMVEAPQVEAVRTPLVRSFPYGAMRPFQKDVLEKIEAALGSGKKFIILEAPVGFGKSAVAAALCRHLRSAYVLTSTKQLQEQYSADFGFTTVMGKSNFTCLVPTSSGRLVACSKGRCEADWSALRLPALPLLRPVRGPPQEAVRQRDSKCEKDSQDGRRGEALHLLQAKVGLVQGEGHRRQLRLLLQRAEVHRGRQEEEAAGLRRGPRPGEAARRLRLLHAEGVHDTPVPLGRGGEFAIPYEEGMDTHAEDWLKALGEARDTLQGFFDAHDGDLTMQDRLISCRGMLESLEGFIDALKADPENWVVCDMRRSTTMDAYGGGSTLVDEVVFQPLDVAAYTSQLFGTAETVLLMSATVFSEELLCRTLGIPQEKAHFIRVAESSFPVENRRIHAMDIAQLSWATMNASMEGIAKAVDEVMDRHAGERGVVHTTSYQQANYIIEHVSERNRGRLVTTEGSQARSELLHTHGATEASVLISPSLYQGVDLKDDLARFQVIVKVPFSDLSDRRTQVKMHRDRGWYDWQTALRLVQTYGRSVRSETDHAVTYVLDSNFTSFVRAHREMFPQYFLEALSEPRGV